jgi:hypothetical protein
LLHRRKNKSRTNIKNFASKIAAFFLPSGFAGLEKETISQMNH